MTTQIDVERMLKVIIWLHPDQNVIIKPDLFLQSKKAKNRNIKKEYIKLSSIPQIGEVKLNGNTIQGHYQKREH